MISCIRICLNISSFNYTSLRIAHVVALVLVSIFSTFLNISIANADSTVLTISGKTAKTASGNLHLTLSEFESIGMSELETTTPWHKEKTRFSGVSGKKLSEYLKVTGSNVYAKALNDYEVVLPVSDLLIDGMILATRIDDIPLSVRTKGPIFLVYPFDQKPELKSEVIYGRSIWQLRALTFK